MEQYKKVFASLDGGETQEVVARRAITVAQNNHAELIFGHVIDSIPYESNTIDYRSLISDCKGRIEDQLKELFEVAQNDEDIPAFHFDVRVGHISETLIEVMVPHYEPGIVICGVRGLSNLKYAFVGSVSTSLIRHLPCDVLVVRTA